MLFTATVKSGNITWDVNALTSHLKSLEGEIDITVEKHKDKRSLKQNRFYWAYLSIVEQETGDNANDLHEYFKRKFLTPRFVTVLGKEIKLPASTTKLKTDQMVDYLDRICALSGVPIPPIN